MEEDISKFVEGLEAQERSGFDDIHTCSASARIQASRMAAPTQELLMEGGAAMSTRLTCGCGVLLVASPAWVV